MKLCFEELEHRNLTGKDLFSILENLLIIQSRDPKNVSVTGIA